jgi:hypothetical protein
VGLLRGEDVTLDGDPEALARFRAAFGP